MKVYTKTEVKRIQDSLTAKAENIKNQIEALQKSKGSLKIFDFTKRKEYDHKIEMLSNEKSYLNAAIILFFLYSDRYTPEPKTHMSDEEWLKIENEAALGDSLSKMLLFHHKCFVERSITNRDFLRLKEEAESGNIYSEFILKWYTEYFTEGDF